MESVGNMNARYRRLINLAHPRADRDAINFVTCRELISMWLPKIRHNTTLQVFTSLNDSILTDVLDPIKPTDGVNRRYLEAQLKELESRTVDKSYLETQLHASGLRVLNLVIKLLFDEGFRECGKKFDDPQELREFIMKHIEKLLLSDTELDKEDISITCPAAMDKGIKESDKAQMDH